MDAAVPMTGGPIIVAVAWSLVPRMYVTAMPGIAMLAMAENHIKPNRTRLQCVVQCCMNRMHNHRHE